MQKLHMVLGIGLINCSTGLLAQDDQTPGSRLIENLDADGDGVISFEEFQESRLGEITRLDEDQNGILTPDEFLNGRPRGGFGNRGGNLDQQDLSDEQLARLQAMRERMAQRANEQFQRMDADGDGLVTSEEFKEQTFLNLDRDQDGVLNARELRPQRGRARAGRSGGRRGPRGGQSDRRGDRNSQQ